MGRESDTEKINNIGLHSWPDLFGDAIKRNRCTDPFIIRHCKSEYVTNKTVIFLEPEKKHSVGYNNFSDRNRATDDLLESGNRPMALLFLSERIVLFFEPTYIRRAV